MLLNPRVIRQAIHKANIDRNLNLSIGTVNILSDYINNTFRCAGNPIENKSKIDEEIKIHRDAVTALLRERQDLKIECEHVWLRRLQSDLPYFCNACGAEVSG